MTLTIYADILFIINFLSDFVILFITGILADTGLKMRRAFFSALVGSFLAVLVLSYSESGFITAFFAVVFPIVACFIAFGKRRKRSFAVIVFCFYISSALLYGGMYSMMNLYYMFFSSCGISGKVSLTLVFMLCAILIYYAFRGLLRRSIRSGESRVKAELCDGTRTYELTLLVDSGNMAKDPFSSKPVAIISAASLDSGLVTALHSAYENNSESKSYNYIHPRVIPLKTVSGTTLLYAFIPESFFIFTGRKKYPADCIVAVDSHDNSFFGQDGIIPLSLLQSL